MTMSNETVAAAMRRVESVLRRRLEAGLQADAPARAQWCAGTRVITRHANGGEIETDMPREIGGSGDRVSPGWLFRAGLAACAATRIAMGAAAAGIELQRLSVEARSRSDARGIFGMADAHGACVDAGPSDVELHVRICAEGVDAERLRRLVEDAHRCSPVARAAQNALPVALRIDIED